MIALPFTAPRNPGLSGERIQLRHPSLGDHAEWKKLREESRAFLSKWEPLWSPDDLARASFRYRVKRYQQELQDGTGYPFFLFRRSDGRMLGGITLGNVRRGVAQSAQIGYWTGAEHAGKGYMYEALQLVVGFAFDTLRLHRLEAACIPENQRSVRLLEKAGFQREGLLRSYLKINGFWQDHLLYSLIEGQEPRRS